jgi:actin related protein 2/3 complex subunit 2
VDYDGVRFHVSTPEKKTELLVSISIRCWEELVQYGANEVLQREYGAYIAPEPEQGYNFSLHFDLEAIPPLGGVFYLWKVSMLLFDRKYRGA